MIQKWIQKYVKYNETRIFSRIGIEFIPKGYHNCQLSIVNCQFDKSQFFRKADGKNDDSMKNGARRERNEKKYGTNESYHTFRCFANYSWARFFMRLRILRA